MPPGSPNSECVQTDQNASFSTPVFLGLLLPFGVGGGWVPTKAIMGITLPTPTPRTLSNISCPKNQYFK